VNMSDSRVQLSFNLNKADWIEEKVRAKMFQIHKNRISKKGEFTVACQITSAQIENYKLALQMIEDHIEEAQKAVANDKWVEEEKLDFQDWVVQKKIAQGREKEIEKRAESIKQQKQRSREKTRSKKMMKSMY